MRAMRKKIECAELGGRGAFKSYSGDLWTKVCL